MSTPAGPGYMVQRVAARAGIGVWRHRGGLLFAAILVAAVGVYASFASTPAAPQSAAVAARGPAAATRAVTAAGGNDCADSAMAVIADSSPVTASRAYNCMDTTFQQRVPEAEFVRQMQSQKLPTVSNVARVGDYKTAAGGKMVYFAVDGGAQSVGYIVYLGQDGKVLRIE